MVDLGDPPGHFEAQVMDRHVVSLGAEVKLDLVGRDLLAPSTSLDTAQLVLTFAYG